MIISKKHQEWQKQKTNRSSKDFHNTTMKFFVI